MNNCVPEMSTDLDGASFPVLVFERILYFLGEDARKSFRLVCTTWNFMVRTLCLKPNSLYIGVTQGSQRKNNESRHLTSFRNCLDMNLLEKDYYTPASSMRLENMYIKDFMEPLVENKIDFRQMIRNVRHLELRKIYFEDRRSVLALLKEFPQLQKLNLRLCQLTKVESPPLSLETIYLPSKLTHLLIEHRHNDILLPGIFISCCPQAKNLEAFTLKITNSENKISPKDFFYGSYNFANIMTTKIRKVLMTHRESLKKLKVDWINDELCSRDRTKSIALHSVTEALLPMMLLHGHTDLSLVELSIELKEINTLHSDFTEVLVPFIQQQIAKCLRKIVLSELVGVFAPGSLFRALSPSNKDGIQKQLDIHLSLRLTKVADSRVAELNRQLLSWKVPCNFLRKLVVEIIPVTEKTFNNTEDGCASASESMYNIKELSEVMALKKKYFKLSEFQLFCHSKMLHSFSIPKLCFQYGHLTILSIKDGFPFSYNDYHEDIRSQQYDDMSLATITDLDMQFIIRRLGGLTSLTLWANLSGITDFSLVKWTSVEVERHFESKMAAEDIKAGLNEYGISYVDQDISKGLKDLEFLSLRGVGDQITDLSIRCGIFHLKRLKFLEILGNHQITEAGHNLILRKTPDILSNINIIPPPSSDSQ